MVLLPPLPAVAPALRTGTNVHHRNKPTGSFAVDDGQASEPLDVLTRSDRHGCSAEGPPAHAEDAAPSTGLKIDVMVRQDKVYQPTLHPALLLSASHMLRRLKSTHWRGSSFGVTGTLYVGFSSVGFSEIQNLQTHY